MVMAGHAQRLAKPLTRGQKRLTAIAVALIVGLSAWAVVGSSSTPASAKGCVTVVVASSTGGEVFSHCGASARRWCASEFTQSDRLALRIQAECRIDGLRPRGS